MTLIIALNMVALMVPITGTMAHQAANHSRSEHITVSINIIRATLKGGFVCSVAEMLFESTYFTIESARSGINCESYSVLDLSSCLSCRGTIGIIFCANSLSIYFCSAIFALTSFKPSTIMFFSAALSLSLRA